MNDERLSALAEELGRALRARGWLLTCAESCTGGWIAKCVTDIAGSSVWMDRGFVTYSNEAKQEMLGVSPSTLDDNGAVSQATVEEMTRGALDNSRADIAVAVSGIAGPGGGSMDKPVGTVWFSWQLQGRPAETRRECFAGDREAVRRQTVALALTRLTELVRDYV